MQIIGFSVRLSSSLLWIQIYRLGVSYVEAMAPREADFDLRNSFLSPATPAVARQCSDSDAVLGGAIYDPDYYSSLFEDGQDNRYLREDQNPAIGGNGSTSTIGALQLKMSSGRSFQVVDAENAEQKPQTV
uniref:Uncharacterized protein n=1 Tax=Rhizophora mucronata TaxID=61149 RepID=A0A2P2PIB9_RHIMU